MKPFSILLFVVTLLLSACNLQATTPPSDAYPAPEGQTGSYPPASYPDSAYPDSGYPGPDEYALPEGYPAPVTEAVAPTLTVTPDPTKGAITGTLLRNNKGVPEAIIYLAEIIKDDQGKDSLAGLDPTKSPSTTTNADGVFVFANIAPGKYQLVLSTVINYYFLYYPGGKQEIIVTVEPNKTFEVGELNYDSLPIPEN